MIAKVNYNQTYQSLQPLWLQLTNLESIITKVNYKHTCHSLQPFCLQLTNLGYGTITKVNYNQMHQSLQPFCLQLTNLEGMITWVNQTYQSLQSIYSLPTWRVPVPTTILPIAYQIWADGFKRWLNGRDHTTIMPALQ